MSGKDEKRKKYMKCCLYLVIFAIFQIGVITLFVLTIAKFRTPTFRVRSATFGEFNVVTTANSPSFNVSMVVEVGVKNTNFGNFKYRDSVVDFYYMDRKVGEGYVSAAGVKARSTRKFQVFVSLLSANVTTGLAGDIGNGAIPLRSVSRLRGRVKILLLLKKNRNANMDCTMGLFIRSRELLDISCK